MSEPMSLLVLGLGNATHGDDGLGAATLGLLRRAWVAPAGVHIAEGRVPCDLRPSHAAVLIDAVRADAPPGAFIRLHGNQVAPAVRERLPGAARLLDSGCGSVILLGIVPDVVGPRPGLSQRVAAGLEGLVRRVVLEARQLGHEFRPRRPPERGGVSSADREG